MTGPAALAYERCRESGEWLLRIGAADAPAILFLPPLFEEMNRTRALIVAAMRGLAARGQGCWLADLPGAGESERALDSVGWGDWRAAAAAAARRLTNKNGDPPLVASIRGGALLDDAAPARGRWRFAPVGGASLVRDLTRAGLAGGADHAGYSPSDTLLAALAAATPAVVAPCRIARLESDRGEAEAKLPGPALWRRSEPGVSPELADAVAADIDAWSRRCASC